MSGEHLLRVAGWTGFRVPAFRRVRAMAPGLFLALVVAAAAKFAAEHTGGPPTVHALAVGVLLGFLAAEPSCGPGLEFAGRSVLRFGIALLGLQLSLASLVAAGPGVLMALVLVSASILAGAAIGRAMGFDDRVALLAAGATSICGASAAMAIHAVLPDGERLNPVKCAVIAIVSLISMLAMLIYPTILSGLGLSDPLIGFVLGASIHDVAQVVSAGYAVSRDAGEAATLVKLARVACLLPFVVAVAALFERRSNPAKAGSSRPPLVPGFMLAFAGLLLCNSVLSLPDWVGEAGGEISRWCLIVAIGSLGVQSSIRQVLSGGFRLAGLICIQSILLFGAALGAALFLERL